MPSAPRLNLFTLFTRHSRSWRDRGLGRLLDREEEALHRGCQRAEAVHLPRYHPARVLQRQRVTVIVDRAERLVHLVEPAVRSPLDDAGLRAVREHLPVVLLQTEADARREVVR